MVGFSKWQEGKQLFNKTTEAEFLKVIGTKQKSSEFSSLLFTVTSTTDLTSLAPMSKNVFETGL
jgi:hypothetical protein